MNWKRTASFALLVATLLVPNLWAQSGGFAAVLDKNSNFGDSRRSVVFYDIDDMSAPIFSVFVGGENGGFEDPNSFTVDPDTGDVYVLAFDSGDPMIPQGTEIEADGDIDGVGDYDLFHIDFSAAYTHWEANFAGSGTYVTYGDGSPFDASHTNPQVAPVITTKIGEIARSQTDGSGSFFEAHLEFLNSDTLLYVDSQTADTGGTTDVQYRSIQRVSSMPGMATAGGTPAGTTGGFNNNTTESWESSIIGHVELDGAFSSEAITIAAVQRDGVTGVWVMEDDGDGDDVAFFEINNLDGTAGNSYRMMDFGTGPVDRFNLDNNPSVDDAEDLGNGDAMLVDRNTGDLVFIESGFFDLPTSHQPTIFKLEIDSYDSGGMIDPGSFSANTVLDLTGIYSDSATGLDIIDGRNAIFDWVNNDVYIFDEDGSLDTLNGGAPFTHDWYKIDLDTGITTAVGPDADESNGLFNVGGVPGDQVLFFNLESTPDLVCDFNGDMVCNLADLDMLYDDIAADAGAGATDMDGDGMVTNNDIDDWLTAAGTENGKTYKAGDVDLDGSVLGSDFTQFASNFGDTGLPGAYWGDGNFDGEDPDEVFRVGGSDFTGLASNFGFTSVSSVPEPGSCGLILLGLASLVGLSRRR